MDEIGFEEAENDDREAEKRGPRGFHVISNKHVLLYLHQYQRFSRWIGFSINSDGMYKSGGAKRNS